MEKGIARLLLEDEDVDDRPRRGPKHPQTGGEKADRDEGRPDAGPTRASEGQASGEDGRCPNCSEKGQPPIDGPQVHARWVCQHLGELKSDSR